MGRIKRGSTASRGGRSGSNTESFSSNRPAQAGEGDIEGGASASVAEALRNLPVEIVTSRKVRIGDEIYTLDRPITLRKEVLPAAANNAAGNINDDVALAAVSLPPKKRITKSSTGRKHGDQPMDANLQATQGKKRQYLVLEN